MDFQFKLRHRAAIQPVSVFKVVINKILYFFFRAVFFVVLYIVLSIVGCALCISGIIALIYCVVKCANGEYLVSSCFFFTLVFGQCHCFWGE